MPLETTSCATFCWLFALLVWPDFLWIFRDTFESVTDKLIYSAFFKKEIVGDSRFFAFYFKHLYIILLSHYITSREAFRTLFGTIMYRLAKCTTKNPFFDHPNYGFQCSPKIQIHSSYLTFFPYILIFLILDGIIPKRLSNSKKYFPEFWSLQKSKISH